MDTLLKILALQSQDHYILDYNLILFEYPRYLFVVRIVSIDDSFELNEWYFEEDAREKSVSDLPEWFFKKIQIDDIRLSDYEYLGDRKDGYTSEVKSICLKLYQIVSEINSINTDAIEYYELSLNEGYDESGGWCPGEPNYIFNIWIRKKYFSDYIFFQSLINLNLPSQVKIPSLYIPSIRTYKQFGENLELKIINSNTKARRIGYVKLLGLMFRDKGKIPLDKLSNRLEEQAVAIADQLSDYINPKGVIQKTKTGNSAKPYVTLSRELEILTTVNRIVVPDKTLKVYLVLKKEDSLSSNAFSLTILDKLFFLERFLINDFTFLNIIFELIYSRQAKNYNDLLISFQPFLIFRISEFIDQHKWEKLNEKRINRLREVQSRIEKWTEPEKYLEHVLMPRINWCIDLGLLTLNIDNSLNLTPEGRRLFEHFCYWNDLNFERVIDPTNFLKTFYIGVFENVYFGRDVAIKPMDDTTIKKVYHYFDESFDYFKTIAPNRVTASQSIRFVIFKLYLRDKIVLSFKLLEDYLLKEASSSYIYKYQTQYGDGYIQKLSQQ